MSLFDFFFGSRAPEIRAPDELRDVLFQAAERGDRKRLERLCRKNRQVVVDNFPHWHKVPQELREDPAAVQRYVHGLVTVAQVFAERLGCPNLRDLLIGTEDSNPIFRWQNRLGQAKQMMAELCYREARDLLTDLLIDVRGLHGSGADTYLPITLGYLGECCFQSREADKAVPYMEQALHLCEQSGDKDGVVAYLGNLYEVHRYLGQGEVAARYAERLADALGEQRRTDEAQRYQRQAGIVRAGEPLNRTVAVVDGVRHELDEVSAAEGKRIQFVFEPAIPGVAFQTAMCAAGVASRRVWREGGCEEREAAQ